MLDTASKLLHAKFAVHFDKLNQSIIYCLPIFLFCCVFFFFITNFKVKEKNGNNENNGIIN